jgi:hypothetical protein
MPALDRLARVAEISLTVARRAGSLALSTARQVAEMALERGASRRTSSPPPSAADRPRSTTTPRAAAPPAPAPARPPAAAPTAPAAPVPTPAAAADADDPPAPASAAPGDEHVDREAVVVGEFADAGAADGAGAQIRVAEPWEGYGSLTAKEVNDRLAAASPESLAVARLYETTHRNRVTVLKEIDRRMAAAGG